MANARGVKQDARPGHAVRLRCAACGRTLLTPAYTAPGRLGYILGPKCAARAGLLPIRHRAVLALAVEVQEGQLGLFD